MAANVLGMAFVPYYNHIMQILETDKLLKQTVLGILKQAGWAASGAAIGGIFAGPLGAAVGGVFGSVIGYKMSDDYESLMTVLRDMDEERKRQLVEKVQGLVGSTGIEALTQFIANQAKREMFAALIRDFASQVKAGG